MEIILDSFVHATMESKKVNHLFKHQKPSDRPQRYIACKTAQDSHKALSFLQG